MAFRKDCKRVKTDGVIWRTQMTALPGHLSFSETWHPRKHLVDLGEPVNLKCQARHPACIPHSTHGLGGPGGLNFEISPTIFFVVNHKEPKIMKRIENPRPPGLQTNHLNCYKIFHVDEIQTGYIWVSTSGINGKDAKYMTEFKELYKTYSHIKALQDMWRIVKTCEDNWRHIKTCQDHSRSIQYQSTVERISTSWPVFQQLCCHSPLHRTRSDAEWKWHAWRACPMANRWLKTLKNIGLQFIRLVHVRGVLWVQWKMHHFITLTCILGVSNL